MAEIAERLHKRIAAAGLCSRRAAEKLILEGRVAVNGTVVRELGIKATEGDTITVDGKPIETAKLHYFVLNKPKGYVTTLADPHAKLTVKDLAPDVGVQVKPVGRLDKDTEGLLLLTNDGALAMRLTHPRYGVEKEYQVAVEGKLTDDAIRRLTTGVFLGGYKSSPAQLDGIFFDDKKAATFFRMTIHEGRKRQIREMCLAVGHPVRKLRRVRFGPLHLSKLPRGQCRTLGKQEVDALYAAVGLARAPGTPPARAQKGKSKETPN